VGPRTGLDDVDNILDPTGTRDLELRLLGRPARSQSLYRLDLSIYGSIDLVGPGLFFSFLILYTAGRTPRTGDQPVARPLPTHRTTQTQ
jgi:hypothetical protein